MKSAPRGQPGFALIEAIVAIVILTIAVTTLAALMTQISRGALRVTGDSYRNAVLGQEINRIEAIPFDSIIVGTQITSVTEQPYPHTRTLIVSSPATNIRKFQLTIAPNRDYFKRDTAVLYRRRARPTNAFNTQL